MIRIVIDSNCIARELAIESARREVRRQRDLGRERTFIFSEGVERDAKSEMVTTRDAGVYGDSMSDELADAAARFAAAQKAAAVRG